MLTCPSTLPTYAAVGSMGHFLSWRRGVPSTMLFLLLLPILFLSMKSDFFVSSDLQLSCLPHFSPFPVPNPFSGLFSYLLPLSKTFTFQTTHISPLQRPAGSGYDPGEETRRVGAKLPAPHPHLQGQAAQARSVHVEKEEIQGGVGFRGHGVSASKPPAVGLQLDRGHCRPAMQPRMQQHSWLAVN